MARVPIVFAMLIATAPLAGCLGGTSDPSEPQATDPTDPAAPANVTILQDGRLEVTVPVNIAVIGFEPDVAAGLQERLEALRVDHGYGSWPRDAPPSDPSDPAKPAKLHPIGTLGWDWRPMPIVPVADYRVHDAGPGLEEAIRSSLEAARDGATLDANPIETALAQTLPEHGIPVDRATPTLVLLHAAELLDRPNGEHAWTYHLPGGPLEEVRVFGEREPVLVLDASAAPDPWTFAPGEEQPTYGTPRNATGEQAVTALVNATRDATHLRLLQGTFYPIEPAPCHAVTVLLADRPRQDAIDRADPTEHVDLERLEDQLDTLTGPIPVHLDARVVHLPADDPGLAQATRGSYAERDGLRAYMDETWEDHWVPQEGCEAYVMLAMVTHDGEFEAVAIYGEDEDRRLGLAISPGTWAEDAPAIERYILHELGHLIGPAHPHSYTHWTTDWSYPGSPGGGFTSRWSSIWSVSSYQTGGGFGGGSTVGLEYGVQDRANTLRAIVGFAWQRIHAQDRTDDPRVDQALSSISEHRWGPAARTLVDVVDDR